MAKKKVRLGVNIDHIATLRNVRNENLLDLIDVASTLKKINVDSLTVHLREDRRHIKDSDVYELREKNILPLNLEMAATLEMQKICLDVKPFACCIVPEKRHELTTEGGLNVKKQMDHLSKIILPILNEDIRLSLFVDPDTQQIDCAHKLGVKVIELHTGKYANSFEKGEFQKDLEEISKSANYAKSLGIECHAGHGLNFCNVKNIIKIPQICELNVGYSLICDSISRGIQNSVKAFQDLIN